MAAALLCACTLSVAAVPMTPFDACNAGCSTENNKCLLDCPNSSSIDRAMNCFCDHLMVACVERCREAYPGRNTDGFI